MSLIVIFDGIISHTSRFIQILKRKNDTQFVCISRIRFFFYYKEVLKNYIIGMVDFSFVLRGRNFDLIIYLVMFSFF